MEMNAHELNDFVKANFSLLSDTDELFQGQLDSNITEEEAVQVQAILLEANAEKPAENDTEAHDFDGQLRPVHVSCSSQKLYEYAEDQHAANTKFQTKWAVNVFRGTKILFSQILSIFSIKSVKKSTVADNNKSPPQGQQRKQWGVFISSSRHSTIKVVKIQFQTG